MSAPTRIDITRHYGELSEKDTDAVVKAVAGLIVDYLKTDRQVSQQKSASAPVARPHQQVKGKETEA